MPSTNANTDTICPYCCNSIHTDKPVGVTTGCGHIWHQDCYRSWQSKDEANSSTEKTHFSNTDCLICHQPTQSFVELFIRLPNITQKHKDLVVKLEHEFNTVCRRTQLSLEREIARRDFEQTWLQEEQQISQAARQRAEKRHEEAIEALETNLRELKSSFEENKEEEEERRKQRRSITHQVENQSTFQNDEVHGIFQFQPNVTDDFGIQNQSLSFSSLEISTTGEVAGDEPRATLGHGNTSTVGFAMDSIPDEPGRTQSEDEVRDSDTEVRVARSRRVAEVEGGAEAQGAQESLELAPVSFELQNQVSPNNLCPPFAALTQTDTEDEERNEDNFTSLSRKTKGSIGESHFPRRDSATDSVVSRGVFEYERQRLEAETAYYQFQAEMVEMERQQAEIELQHDELALQEREQRIRMERSRLEKSFSSIQRRVQESKQEVRDRQRLAVMEEKFAKYKIARVKEEERYEQELEHLMEDESHIQERKEWERQRQEAEKVRLKKEIRRLIKAMKKLERAKKLAKLAEEQSSASQSQDTCVICFDPLVSAESELGVVECGHTYHVKCWMDFEKSKRRRGASSIPCPLCNVPINNVCVTMRFGSSLYCNSKSSLAKHFQREEGRWQRRRLHGLGLTGEASS